MKTIKILPLMMLLMMAVYVAHTWAQAHGYDKCEESRRRERDDIYVFFFIIFIYIIFQSQLFTKLLLTLYEFVAKHLLHYFKHIIKIKD